MLADILHTLSNAKEALGFKPAAAPNAFAGTKHVIAIRFDQIVYEQLFSNGSDATHISRLVTEIAKLSPAHVEVAIIASYAGHYSAEQRAKRATDAINVRLYQAADGATPARIIDTHRKEAHRLHPCYLYNELTEKGFTVNFFDDVKSEKGAEEGAANSRAKIAFVNYKGHLTPAPGSRWWIIRAWNWVCSLFSSPPGTLIAANKAPADTKFTNTSLQALAKKHQKDAPNQQLHLYLISVQKEGHFASEHFKKDMDSQGRGPKTYLQYILPNQLDAISTTVKPFAVPVLTYPSRAFSGAVVDAQKAAEIRERVVAPPLAAPAATTWWGSRWNWGRPRSVRTNSAVSGSVNPVSLD